MLKVNEKVFILVVIVALMVFFSWLLVGLASSMLATPLFWLFVIVGIALALLDIVFLALGGYAFWYIWKKVPTLTKKNEALLKEWLKNHGYVRCKEVYVVITKSHDYKLNDDGSLSEIDKQITGSKIVVHEHGVAYSFVPSTINAVTLLDNYEYCVQDNDFMILKFKYDKAKMLVYRQYLS